MLPDVRRASWKLIPAYSCVQLLPEYPFDPPDELLSPEPT